jgi:predicted PurR-regulated permease PerM
MGFRFRHVLAILALALVSVILLPTLVFAGSDAFTQKDRELLIRLDERLNQIDKRFEQIDKRFEQIDKRFEELRQDMNNRFEQVDKRFDNLINIMISIVCAFAGIVAVTISFAIWDRRTMVRPFEREIGEIRQEISHEQAKVDRNLAEILRNFSIL